MSPRYGQGHRGWEVGRPARVSRKGWSQDWPGATAPACGLCCRRASPRRTHTGPRGWVQASLGTAGPGTPRVPQTGPSSWLCLLPLQGDTRLGVCITLPHHCQGAVPGRGPTTAVPRSSAPPEHCSLLRPRFRFKPKSLCSSLSWLWITASASVTTPGFSGQGGAPGATGCLSYRRSPEEVTPGPESTSSFTSFAGHLGSAMALPCPLRTGQVRLPPQARPEADSQLQGITQERSPE